MIVSSLGCPHELHQFRTNVSGVSREIGSVHPDTKRNCHYKKVVSDISPLTASEIILCCVLPGQWLLLLPWRLALYKTRHVSSLNKQASLAACPHECQTKQKTRCD
jgi:hypothetical protein